MAKLIYTCAIQAEEITLTIGQAFDLAYRRFLETTGRELEGRRQISQLQANVERLECENRTFRRRLSELSVLVETNKLKDYLESHGVSNRRVQKIFCLIKLRRRRRFLLFLFLSKPDMCFQISELFDVNHEMGLVINTIGSSCHNATEGTLINLKSGDQIVAVNRSEPLSTLPPVPPRSFEKNGTTDT